MVMVSFVVLQATWETHSAFRSQNARVPMWPQAFGVAFAADHERPITSSSSHFCLTPSPARRQRRRLSGPLSGSRAKVLTRAPDFHGPQKLPGV